MRSSLWVLAVVYLLLFVPLLLSFLRQLRIYKQNIGHNNGLHNWRRALTITTFFYLLDSAYFLLAITIGFFDRDMMLVLLFGLGFIIVKIGFTIGAWIYYALYSEEGPKFLSWHWWKDLLN